MTYKDQVGSIWITFVQLHGVYGVSGCPKSPHNIAGMTLKWFQKKIYENCFLFFLKNFNFPKKIKKWFTGTKPEHSSTFEGSCVPKNTFSGLEGNLGVFSSIKLPWKYRSFASNIIVVLELRNKLVKERFTGFFEV